MRNLLLVLIVAVLLTSCGEDGQVMRPIGIARTSSTSSVMTELSFVDSGRWTIFEFASTSAELTWPLPFHAQIVDSAGKTVIEREVADGPELTGADGIRRLTWRLDTLSEPFEKNFDDDGLMPIDHVLEDGERYTLRLLLPAGDEREYEVYVLETRRIYPWDHGT
jgi:hypothetical protein